MQHHERARRSLLPGVAGWPRRRGAVRIGRIRRGQQLRRLVFCLHAQALVGAGLGELHATEPGNEVAAPHLAGCAAYFARPCQDRSRIRARQVLNFGVEPSERAS